MSEKIPSGRCSPASVEKSNSSSSRESDSSIHFDFDSYIPSQPLNSKETIRPSSWDESDDDLLPENEGNSEPTELHLSDSQKFKASVAAEINELKKQFFESLQKLKSSNYEPFESSTSISEMKPEDRRQCPARVRRRTKSSSSLSPVLEAKSHSSSEKLSGLDEKFDEISSKILDLNPKYYLNNFFNDLRMRRISLIDPSAIIDKTEEEESEWKNQEEEPVPFCNDLNTLDSNENDEHFCKTSRKLSQIIEVEENKRDLERSSEEISENSDLFSKSLKKPEENISPLQTARSRNEKISENLGKTENENFKSLSYEEFGNFQKVQKPFESGSLSERYNKHFRNKPRDNFSFLSVKSPKPGITSLKLFHKKNSPKTSNKFVSFKNQLEPDKDYVRESSSNENEKENLDCLKIDLMKNLFEDTSPRSTDRSDLSRTTRTRSGKSRNSYQGSPKFKVNTGRDSAGSLKLEDITASDFIEKVTEIDIESDSSSKKSRRNQSGSENRFEQKSDRDFRIPLKSPSLESVKSTSSFSKEPEMNSSKRQKSKSTERSQRENERMRINGPGLVINEPNEYYVVVESNRSYEIPPNSRVGSPIQENYKNLSQRSMKTAYKLSRSTRSDKTKTPKTAKFLDFNVDQESQTPELELSLDISESQKSSYRSPKSGELKNTGRSDLNNSKRSSRRSSDRSSSLKSQNTESAKTPKITPRSSISISNRSKESHDNPENPGFETNSWRELEKINDSLSNRTSGRSSSRKSSWRNQKSSSQGNSPYKRSSTDLNDYATSKNNDLEERHSASGKSSRRSIESTRNSSPTKSIKFSPSEERETNSHPDIEKLYLEVTNERISNKISSNSDDENIRKTPSTQTLRSEGESARYSENKLSVINEVSLEDLEISNDSNENEESSKEQSRRSSRSQNVEYLPQSINLSSKNTSRSRKQTPKDEPNQEESDVADGEKWNELIEAFNGSPNSSPNLEKKFQELKNSWDSLKENTYTINSKGNQKATVTGNKYETSERYFAFENEMEDKEEDSKNSFESLLEKPVKKEMSQLQNFQNLYYFNVNERKPFGIGECGDVTNWNVDKSDTPEKPKAYGDGIQLHEPSEVLAVLGRKEKEVKIQRHLWTDLRGDFRNSKQTLQKLFFELEDHTISKNIIPIGLKTSKSDNCIIKKNSEDAQIENYELKNKSKSQVENSGDGITTKKDLSAESLECEKEDVEFDCKTPRLSRSMIDLKIELEKETFEDVELNTNFNSSGSQLFEKGSATSKEEKESTNLNIFLARDQNKRKTNSNNWLNFKTLEMEKSLNKKEKKIKKRRKELRSPKDKHREYLCTGRSRSSVPALKLRNRNCFQNFYKCIVSVFCLTSHSSAATSK